MPLRQLVSFLTRPTQAPRRSGRITAKLHTRTRLGPSRSPANHCRGPPRPRQSAVAIGAGPRPLCCRALERCCYRCRLRRVLAAGTCAHSLHALAEARASCVARFGRRRYSGSWLRRRGSTHCVECISAEPHGQGHGATPTRQTACAALTNDSAGLFFSGRCVRRRIQLLETARPVAEGPHF